eukprot:1153559-Rhodomonas_salina.1
MPFWYKQYWESGRACLISQLRARTQRPRCRLALPRLCTRLASPDLPTCAQAHCRYSSVSCVTGGLHYGAR